MLESVIDSDMCGVESIKLLYLLSKSEFYVGLIHGRRSSTRLPLPQFQLQHFGSSLHFNVTVPVML